MNHCGIPTTSATTTGPMALRRDRPIPGSPIAIRLVGAGYLMTRMLKVVEAGVSAPPDVLHSRTTTVLAAETRASIAHAALSQAGAPVGDATATIEVVAPVIVATVP